MKKITVSFLALIVLLSFASPWGCAKKGGDPLDDIHRHIKSMLKIVKDNKADCNKVVSELETYLAQHKAEFVEIQKKTDAMRKSMTPEDLKKYQEKEFEKNKDVVTESMAVVMEINQKCPEQAAKIGEVLRAVK